MLDDVLASATADERGALWRLAEPGRELDANVVRLAPDAGVDEHQEDTLDVLLVVIAGSGTLTAGEDTLKLAPSTVTWLPRTSRRALAAGPDGLTYLTVHRRRPGLTVKPSVTPSAVYEGGEGPCMLDRVCPDCGRMSSDPAPRFCKPRRGPFPGR